MKKQEIDIFEKLSGQLIGVYEEISLLSKKNSNDAVNKFKLKFINKIISDSNVFLTKKYFPFDDFISFYEDDVPQNSDVVFILSQYLQCFEKLKADNVSIWKGTWCWRIKGEKGDQVDEKGFIHISTTKPKGLRD